MRLIRRTMTTLHGSAKLTIPTRQIICFEVKGVPKLHPQYR